MISLAGIPMAVAMVVEVRDFNFCVDHFMPPIGGSNDLSGGESAATNDATKRFCPVVLPKVWV